MQAFASFKSSGLTVSVCVCIIQASAVEQDGDDKIYKLDN